MAEAAACPRNQDYIRIQDSWTVGNSTTKMINSWSLHIMLDTHSIWCFSQYAILLYSTSIYVVHVVPLKKTSAMKRLEPSKQETTMLGVAWRCLFQDVLSPYIFTIMYMIINIYVCIFMFICKIQNKNLTQIQEQIASWALWVIARKNNHYDMDPSPLSRHV